MMDSPKDLPAWPDPNRYWEGCEYETELICALRARLGLAVNRLDHPPSCAFTFSLHNPESATRVCDCGVSELIAACREPDHG